MSGLHHRGVSVAETLVPDHPNMDSTPASLPPAEGTPSLTKINQSLLPRTIPLQHSNRTLVLCFDGTGDQFDADNSNIVQLFSMLKKDDRNKQMVYYQSGIGTYICPQAVSPFTIKAHKVLDQMLAFDLDSHVMDGYKFLMQNYIEGDRISIFGFSRGAYTARSLAGMLHKVGLLPPDNDQQVPFAYKMYTKTDQQGWEQSNLFRKSFSIEVKIDFLGVWDTVDSVGLVPRRLPFTTSNTIVRTFRHALSLDEHRAKFKANHWNRPTDYELLLDDIRTCHTKRLKTLKKFFTAGPAEKLADSPPRTPSKRNSNSSTHAEHSSNSSQEDNLLSEFESKYGSMDGQMTDVEEVWFSGCHADVGGGSVSNETRHSLARISLRWMIRECFKAQTGIMFHTERLREIGLDPSTLYPYVISPRPPPISPLAQSTIEKYNFTEHQPKPTMRQKLLNILRPKSNARRESISSQPSSISSTPSQPLTEEEEELHDSLSPLYDQLKLNRVWWILELLPMEFRFQDSKNEWKTWFGSNLARPRYIPDQHREVIKVHRSVKIRMHAQAKHMYNGKEYRPKAIIRHQPLWVD